MLINERNDVVIASRYREGSHFKGLSDFTCGFRAYRASAIQTLIKIHGLNFVSERGFSCMVDILLKLRLIDELIFTEVPMVLRYDQKVGVSKMRVMQTVFDTLNLMARRRLLGKNTY